MKTLLNPKWLLLTFLLPICILFGSYYGVYKVIGTLLSADNIQFWKIFGWTLFGISTLQLAYTTYCIKLKKELSIHYGYITLLVFSIFLYFYCYYYNHIIPFNVPQWMISENMTLYAGTFIMPVMLHALFVLTIKLTREDKTHHAGINFLISICIPILCYAFFVLLLPLWRHIGNDFHEHSIVIFLVIATVLFFFFVVRVAYILFMKKGEGWKQYQLIGKIMIALIMPLLGLAINNGHPTDYSFTPTGVFGDFNSFWFYGLAIINGIFICLPSLDHKTYRTLLFIGRSVTFTYTFYFFLVFLPYLPLAIPAIIAIGLGFLMLTPLILFVVHVRLLVDDFSYLNASFSKYALRVIAICSLFVIPICLTTKFLNDKRVLSQTLDYLYTSNYKSKQVINTKSLKSTLQSIKRSKSSQRTRNLSNPTTPYLSSFFTYLVMDNLTLSSAKINKIERVFFDAPDNSSSIWRSTFNDDVITDSISTSSTFDANQNTWTSWVDLELLHPSGSRRAEYNIDIDLPAGCWISDYYLYVGDKKEMGILAEKKAAMWVYSNITAGRRDPGILHYKSGNKVAFRVFPFQSNERRKTGIQFVHREPISLMIDGNIVNLGTSQEQNQSEASYESDDATYISSKEKEKLPKVQRKPYFHFIVDASNRADSLQELFIANINQFVSNQNSSSSNNLVTFCNSYSSTYQLSKINEETNTKHGGGFFVERAISEILTNSYTMMSEDYPIIVVVTDDMQNCIIEKSFANYAAGYPESDKFYHLNLDGNLVVHSLRSNPKTALPHTKVNFEHEVYVWSKDQQKKYLPLDNAGSIIVKNKKIKIDNKKDKQWITGLKLYAKHQHQVFFPSSKNTEWLEIIQGSFSSKIMTPYTSYLVVENEAQKAALRKKQKHILAGNKSLDAGDIDRRMSEPGLILMCGLFGMFLLWKRSRRKIAR